MPLPLVESKGRTRSEGRERNPRRIEEPGRFRLELKGDVPSFLRLVSERLAQDHPDLSYLTFVPEQAGDGKFVAASLEYHPHFQGLESGFYLLNDQLTRIRADLKLGENYPQGHVLLTDTGVPIIKGAEVEPLPVSRNGSVWMDIQNRVGGYPARVSHSVLLNITGDARGQLVKGFLGVINGIRADQNLDFSKVSV